MKKLSTTPRNQNIKNKKAGSVMMEYVIVAVMIAAAVVFGARAFGDVVLGQFKASSEAMVGQTTTAGTTSDTTATTAATDFGTAATRSDDITNQDQE